MRIAFVVHDYHRSGGHSRYVAELATRFARTNEVHVFANRITTEGNSDIHFHHVPAWRRTSLSTVLTFAAPVSLMARGFDIVHSQGFCGWGANVLTTHMCSRAWHLACRRHEGRMSVYHSLFNWMTSGLERALYSQSGNTRVIAISELVASDIRKHYGCTLPTDIIYHGVDLDLFSPAVRQANRHSMRARLGFKAHDFVFLYVGDLRKGAMQCISALAGMNGGHLLLVSRSAVEDYRRRAAELGIVDRVHFAGPTDHIETCYAAADAFVLPSPYDTFAMVTLEAMACSLPVIVSCTAGSSELVKHGANGFVLQDPGNIVELTTLMREMTDQPDRAVSIGCAARRTAENHSWDAVAAHTMRVYKAVCAQAAPR